MFPFIPALIFLLLHGPSNFDRLAESGRLPSALAVLHTAASREAVQPDSAREDISRRVLATLIAASGDRALSEAFASMFLAGESRPATSRVAIHVEAEASVEVSDGGCAPLRDGFLKCVRSRDGPLAA